MRFSAACRLFIKIFVFFSIIFFILSVSFQHNPSKSENVTAAPVPITPEEELRTYIRNLSSWKERNETIINPHPYKYLNVPINTCKKNGAASDPFIVIVVKSYVSNIGHREAIRSTWGKDLPPTIKLVFLLGYLNFMKSYIEIESKRYKDIVQEDFIDVYRNNTIKTIMGFNWVVTNCAEAPYIFFVDDDYIVNVPKVLFYLQIHFRRNKGQGRLYVGYKWEKAYPKRGSVSKWYVPLSDYPCKFWPPYVGGGSMVISMNVATEMTEAFPHIKPIFIDDVYIGIVAATLGVSVTMEGKFSPDYHLNKIQKMFSIHGVESSSTLIQDWEKVKDKINTHYH